MNHDGWYGYSRNQNLNKQDNPKIVIAGTALNIEAAVDFNGDFATNDKRVYSVYANRKDLYFLCAILNGPVFDFVFRRIARPKAGGYFDIETQFLAPLPVPKATKEQKKDVGERAKALQELYTMCRNKVDALEKRFGTCPVKKRNEDWLFPKIRSMDHWKAEAPDDLSARDKTKWAKEQRNLKIEERLEAIDTRLSPSVQLNASFKNGELLFTIDGVAVIDNVFVSDDDGLHILTYWQHHARTTSITKKFKAKTLIGKLMATPMTDNADLAAQITKLTAEIDALDSEISIREQELNETIYGLYELTDEERRIIQ